MKTFIKVTEIWVPNKQRTHLELKNGIYGDYDEFRAASEKKQFSYQQGLPGSVWAVAHPVVITDLEDSYFERKDEARTAGLTCAVGIPIMSGEFLMAVLIFLCAGDEEHAGVLEVWANDADRINELGVISGYYGDLEYFEFISRKTKIMKSFGLPGQVWEKGMPILMDDLGNSTSFIRGKDAKNAGITTGLAIPVAMNQDQIYIMAFLSAKKTPIANGMQIWVPDDRHQKLFCQTFYNVDNNDSVNAFVSQEFTKGEGIVGQAWLTGIPMVSEKNASNMSSVLAMPIIDQGHLKAVVSFMF